MSIKPRPIPSIPKTTKRIAQAAFPKGNIYLQMRDELGELYTDDLFSDLYASEGQPAFSPWRLALVTVMQFAENLSDRQAADAVRARLDLEIRTEFRTERYGFPLLYFKRVSDAFSQSCRRITVARHTPETTD